MLQQHQPMVRDLERGSQVRKWVEWDQAQEGVEMVAAYATES